MSASTAAKNQFTCVDVSEIHRVQKVGENAVERNTIAEGSYSLTLVKNYLVRPIRYSIRQIENTKVLGTYIRMHAPLILSLIHI